MIVWSGAIIHPYKILFRQKSCFHQACLDHLVPQCSMRKRRHLACVCLEKSASCTLETTEGLHCFLPLILNDDTRWYFAEHHGFCRKSVAMMTPHLYLWETPLWKSSSKDWNDGSHNHTCQSYMIIYKIIPIIYLSIFWMIVSDKKGTIPCLQWYICQNCGDSIWLARHWWFEAFKLNLICRRQY